MASEVLDLSAQLHSQIAAATADYQQYQARQQYFNFPVVHISAEPVANADSRRMHIHMEVVYSNTSYSFDPITPEHTEQMQRYLNSDPNVRAKFADGKVVPIDATIRRVKTLAGRFALNPDNTPAEPNLHLYSGFIVSDVETADAPVFLGHVGIGGADTETRAELFFLNRAITWSHIPEAIVAQYPAADRAKQYQGVATAEVATMLQYGQYLKDHKYKVAEKELSAIEMTARTDNPGSWKSGAKCGFELEKVAAKEHHSKDLRYHMVKALR